MAMLIKTFAGAIYGVDAYIVTMEVNVCLPYGFVMVGLPDSAVRESKERIVTAIRNNGFEWPRRRITINMAPAGIRKEGSAYDLCLAIAILAATGQVGSERLGQYLILGELSLDGSLQRITGALPIAIQARKAGFKGIVLPAANAAEAAIVNHLDVIPVQNLQEAVTFLDGRLEIAPLSADTRELFETAQRETILDFAEVHGQLAAKRAMEVAAAGGHNLLMVGAPGAGKTMLAKRLPTILPPLSLQEALEATKIYSVAGKLGVNASLMAHRPFRSPHHTTSDVALVGGGGAAPQPGEISLAHNGVLFLDELPEFRRGVLEAMRQPLEERRVTVSRAKFTVDYPANFMLVASMNPCPCGFYNHPERGCICSAYDVQRYLGKISGPLMDRIDLHVEVAPVKMDDLVDRPKGESSESIRERVIRAREHQIERFKDNRGIYCNAMMPAALAQRICALDLPGKNLIHQAVERLGLSVRAYERILKVARTVADLDNADDIRRMHVGEAISYRNLDRAGWAGGGRL